jgi:hypothetical protein
VLLTAFQPADHYAVVLAAIAAMRTKADSLMLAALSSLSAPLATISNPSSANGRCSALASSHGARIQTSRSSSVVRITGIASG